MNEQEIMALIEQLRVQLKKENPNKTDEEINETILEIFFNAWIDEKMDRHDLRILAGAVGYEIKDEVLDEIEKEKKGEN